MKKNPTRTRPWLSFEERLKRFANQARSRAQKLPPGSEGELLEQENDTAAKVDRWLSSPGLRRPR
jgi:hypothetical protein